MESHAWTLTEAAAILGVSRWTLRQYRVGNRLVFPDGREIEMYTFGGRSWKIPKVALRRFLGEEVAAS